MEKSINERLKELYSLYWDSFSNKLNKIVTDDKYVIKPTNPLLLSHSDLNSFEQADIRVMIIGQETNDWGGSFNNDLDNITTIYNSFYKGNKFAHKGYFKNHFNKIVDLLENKFPDKKIGFFWNNVIKVGKANNKGIPPKYILDIIKDDFSILSKEIEIIRPNLILFLSGPDYDKYILEQIPNIEKKEMEGYKSNVLISFKIKNVDYTFRTYHPNKMNFLGKNEYDKIYNSILTELTF